VTLSGDTSRQRGVERQRALDRAFTPSLRFQLFRIPNGDSGRPGKYLCRTTNAFEAPRALRLTRPIRPFIVLVLVFVTAFFAAIAAQIKAHHDNAPPKPSSPRKHRPLV
jgi:hypothetical protein